MSKSTDVTLNIRARNLAGRTLAEINDQVEQLAKNNDAQATSAQKAARSMRDLNETSRQLAGAYRELSRREGITRSFVEQQEEIRKTSQRLVELTNRYREMGKGVGTTTTLADMQALGREIIEVNDRLQRMQRDNAKAAGGLAKIGVDANNAAGDLGKLQQAVARAGTAYKAAEADLAGYSQEQRRAAEIAAEAARRQAAAQEQINRAREGIRRIGARSNELAVLRADIEARSAAARATDVQAEAQRRLAAEQADAAARQERATAAIREAVQAYDAQQARRAQARAAFEAEAAAIERAAAAGERRRNQLLATNRAEAESAARKERLAALLRRKSQELDANTGALNRNAAASRTAGSNLALFSDVGRKSLGTYQRLRGQILGLTAAYVGFYQVINTTQKAVAATNRNQSLMVGLRTVNNGDAAAAASDYRFLRQEAERLGLVFDDLAPQFANVAISGKTLGMNTTQVRDLFSDTATAAAAMNLSVADAEGVFRAVTQVMSKGKVQAEELRGQLGDRLPGAVAIFAKASNLSLKDLDKQLEKGTLGVDFLVRGMKEYANVYADEIGNISTRLQAYINNAKNAYNDFLRSLLTGANDEKLKQAFARISTFFRSSEGQKFAEALATAFGKAIDVFIDLANRIDLVVLAVKAFIGLQLLKFLNDTYISVVKLGTAFATGTKWLLGYNTAQRAAALGATTLAGRLRLLAIAGGPVVAIITTLAGGIYLFTNRLKNATQRTEEFADALHGLTFARTEEQLSDAMTKGQDEVAKLTRDIEMLDKALDNNGGYWEKLKDGVARVGEMGVMSRGEAETRLTQARDRLRVVTEGLIGAQFKLDDALEARRKREEEERTSPLPTLTPDGKGDKTADASDRRARNEENRRLTAARAIQKEMLDLDQAVFQARIDGEVRTAEQVRQAYQIAVDTIASETEERYLKLQQLAQAVFAAQGINTPAAGTGDARADYEAMVEAAERLGLAEAANMRALLGRVEALRLARNDKAFEASETQDIEVLERGINDLLDQRNSKVEYYNTLREAGLIGELDAYNAINATQDGYNQRIAALVQTILPLLTAIDEKDPRYAWAQGLIADFETLLVQQRQFTAGQRLMLVLGEQVAGGMASALTELGRGIADAARGFSSWSDAFKAARDAFLNFAADFLQQIAQMIMQAIILQAIQNAISGGSGGYWQAAFGAITGSKHTGGIAGQSGGGPKRRVDARVFAGAQRFHEGGLPGLRSGEVATILKKGEEVVTEDNPRHIGNAGSGGVEVNNITVLDPSEVISSALRSGKRTVINDLTAAMRSNRNEIRTALGL